MTLLCVHTELVEVAVVTCHLGVVLSHAQIDKLTRPDCPAQTVLPMRAKVKGRLKAKFKGCFAARCWQALQHAGPSLFSLLLRWQTGDLWRMRVIV